MHRFSGKTRRSSLESCTSKSKLAKQVQMLPTRHERRSTNCSLANNYLSSRVRNNNVVDASGEDSVGTDASDTQESEQSPTDTSLLWFLDNRNSRSSLYYHRRHCGTILMQDDHQDLFLFREEAEYSDYLSAMLTGRHLETDGVVFYEIEVNLSQRKWTIWRRFSEFRGLRRQLIKHFTKRLKRAANNCSSRCEICANLLQTIEGLAFPSRQQRKGPWKALFSRSSSSSHKGLDNGVSTIIDDRKAKFHDFLSICLVTIRGLRQHGNVMTNSSLCEISVASQLMEEFLELNFTRYLQFLGERGIGKNPS